MYASQKSAVVCESRFVIVCSLGLMVMSHPIPIDLQRDSRRADKACSVNVTSYSRPGPQLLTSRMTGWSATFADMASPDAQESPPPDPWFRTRSPEQAVDVRGAAFYPHQLRLLGSSNNFAFKQRVSHVGPITVGDTVYETDVAVEFDDDRANYHVLIPLNGWLESRYRGRPLTSTPALASIYRPDAEMAATWWPGGSRHLAVKIDQMAVDRSLEALIQGSLSSPIEFDPSLPLQAGAAQEWVRLLLMVHRQLENPSSMVGHPLVLAPLVESLIHELPACGQPPLSRITCHARRTRQAGRRR